LPIVAGYRWSLLRDPRSALDDGAEPPTSLAGTIW
jgi:hypothetical protein